MIDIWQFKIPQRYGSNSVQIATNAMNYPWIVLAFTDFIINDEIEYRNGVSVEILIAVGNQP